eukprot:400529_1
MNDYCPAEPFQGSFLELSLSIPIFIIFQLLLLIHTLFYEYKYYQEKRKIINSNISVRILFILLQICGLYWTFIDLLRFIIDPNTFMLRNNIGCALVAHSPKIAPIIYYTIYLHIILLRLKLSFKDTYVAIHKCTFIILLSIIIIPFISFFILLYLISEPYCVWKWTPVDFDMTLTFCDIYTSNKMRLLTGSGVCWIIGTNIILNAILCMKLRIFLKKMDHKSSFKLKSLKIRNCILTIIASFSTLLTWCCWLILGNILPFSVTFVLYFDVWFNCIILSLLFKHNDYYYKKLCKYCIIGCFQICDKKYETKKLKQYLNNNTNSIFASTTKPTSTSTDHNTTTSASNTTTTTMSTNASTTISIDTTCNIPSIQITEIIYADIVHPTPVSNSVIDNKQLQQIDL